RGEPHDQALRRRPLGRASRFTDGRRRCPAGVVDRSTSTVGAAAKVPVAGTIRAHIFPPRKPRANFAFVRSVLLRLALPASYRPNRLALPGQGVGHVSRSSVTLS